MKENPRLDQILRDAADRYQPNIVAEFRLYMRQYRLLVNLMREGAVDIYCLPAWERSADFLEAELYRLCPLAIPRGFPLVRRPDRQKPPCGFHSTHCSILCGEGICAGCDAVRAYYMAGRITPVRQTPQKPSMPFIICYHCRQKKSDHVEGVMCAAPRYDGCRWTPFIFDESVASEGLKPRACQHRCPTCDTQCNKKPGHAEAGYDGIAGLCWCSGRCGKWWNGEKDEAKPVRRFFGTRNIPKTQEEMDVANAEYMDEAQRAGYASK